MIKTCLSALCLLLAIGCRAAPLVDYDCRRASCAIKIDGKIDEAAWRKASVITFVLPVTSADPLSKTEAMVLWDDDYLYVAYRAYDKDVWSIRTERDSTTCQEDCLECFVQPNPDADPYTNFEINALGTVYDASALKRNSGGYDCHRWNKWNCEGLRVGIDIDGTLNNPTDIDKCWQMEIAVPFAELPSLMGKKPKCGDRWNILLARYDFSVYLPEGVELSSCSALTKANFHIANEWSHMKFISAE